MAVVTLVPGCSEDDPIGPTEPPSLTRITPDAGVPGTTVDLRLTGTNFGPNSTVNVSGADVTVTNITFRRDTSLHADLQIGEAATLGVRQVTVTTRAGTSNSRGFTLQPPGPTVAGVAPAAGVRGTTVPVTLTGTNFIVDATTVAVSGGQVTVTNVDVGRSTSLSADVVISDNAAIGARELTVTTPGGSSNAQTFTVQAPPPVLTSITPQAGARGSTVRITLTGTDLITRTTTVNVSGDGVTVENLSNASETSLTADLVIAEDAALGERDVTVTTGGETTGGGNTAPQTFTIEMDPT